MTGPLAGLRVIEMAGLGPTPHAAMMLADLGADVVQIGRPGEAAGPDGIAGADRALMRNRRLAQADLKNVDDRELALALVDSADVLLEGFRPGVMERLGLGPDICLARNPCLVYGRMTGWGQSGPLARRAGHDINYLALTGILETMGPAGAPPLPPLNLVADFGGGSMLLVFGVMAALWQRGSTGLGQIVDAAMIDGSGLLAQGLWSWKAAGRWSAPRGENILDGSAPFYRTYECASGGYMAVGALEPQFYARMLAGLELDASTLPDQWDRSGWEVLTVALVDRFAGRSRADWTRVFAGIDACVTPVLSFAEAPSDPHMLARNNFLSVAGVVQAAPGPRFSGSAVLPVSAAAVCSLADVVTQWAGAGTR